MDQVFMDALITQALGAYRAGGAENLKRWLDALPAPHQEEFRKHCAKPLEKAMMDQLSQSIGELLAEPVFGPPATDPRKKHTRDRRRTKPL